MADFSLFRLTGAYLELQDKLATDPDGDYQDTIDSITDAAEVKLDNYQHVVDNFKAQNEGLKAERDRLNARIKQNDTAIKRLQTTMLSSVEALGGKLRTEKHTFSLRHSKRLIVDDHAKIPDAFYKPAEVNKKLLGDSVKAGHKYDGVYFEEHTGLGVR